MTPRPTLSPPRWIPALLLAALALMALALLPEGRHAASKTSSDALEESDRQWLPGDHHIHSRRSENYEESTDPPTPIAGTDADYPIVVNAMKAREYDLAWMVSTDHGGPTHSAFNLEHAYPEIVQSRSLVPEVLQFYGMEFDVPGGNHASLIIPQVAGEDSMLYEIERRFGEEEVYPEPPSRDTDEKMLEALRFMREFEDPPLVLVNHPTRSGDDYGSYGGNPPEQLRSWNDTAPQVAVGMEGAPGHQGRLAPDGTVRPDGARGSYDEAPTMGGFDQMTAQVGGVWDSFLAEGRRWWITATSDLHYNWRDGGGDFWPGEYSKTYVYAEKTYDDVLDGLRNGRVFVTLGDLVTELYVTAEDSDGATASIGETLSVTESESSTEITIRFWDPDRPNARGETPSVRRVDLILGEVTGPSSDSTADRNESARVVRRFTSDEWSTDGDYAVITHRLEPPSGDYYIRVRGTNTEQMEPEPDSLGEDPWADLWFYSNPIFVERP